MEINDFVKFLKSNNIDFDENVILSKKTWIHRGGKCRLYILPKNSENLEKIIAYLANTSLNYLVVGCTSNIYIKNNYAIDVVISTIRCRSFIFNEKNIICECGVLVSKLAKECVSRGIAGFEYLTSLPGTIAGGVYNNSSCRANCITDNIKEVKFIDKAGRIHVLTKNDLSLSFRSTIFKEKKILGCILSVTFNIVLGNSEHLRQIAHSNEENRKQILESPSKNLGCTVNRPFLHGKMFFPLRILLLFNRLFLKMFFSTERVNIFTHNLLFAVTGNRELGKYVSPRNVLTFMWLDEEADNQFENYLLFMKKYYKTDSVEIEILN